jgi:hypothetical protein
MTALQEHVHQLRCGQPPLPLTDGQAVAQAMRLRFRGVSYPQIAVVMGMYHGHWFSSTRWRHACRARGVPPINRGFGRTQ